MRPKSPLSRILPSMACSHQPRNHPQRHLISLKAQNPQLTLIFTNAHPSDPLLQLCQQLNDTIAIAWISDTLLPNLQTFSPQQPNLIETILEWIDNRIGKA